MEANNKRRIGGLKDKIPDIQKTLETVRFLQKRDVSVVVLCGAVIYGSMRGERSKQEEARNKKQQKRRKEKQQKLTLLTPPPTTNYQEDSEPLEATFELNDTLFAKAHIQRTQEVYLWLGVSPFLSSPSLFFPFVFHTHLHTHTC